MEMTNSPWYPIAIPAVCDATATPYGYMIDHLWRDCGTNIARRPHWPAEMFITVEPFEDHEIAAMGGEWSMSHGVFFDAGIEYGSPVGDMEAADWLVGRIE